MYYSFRTKAGASFRTKAQKYKDYIENIWYALDNKLTEETVKDIKINCVRSLELTVSVQIPEKDWQTKQKKLKRHDVSNFIKTTEDAVFKYFKEKLSIDIDDNQVMLVMAQKEKSIDSNWNVQVQLHFLGAEDSNHTYIHRFDKEGVE